MKAKPSRLAYLTSGSSNFISAAYLARVIACARQGSLSQSYIIFSETRYKQLNSYPCSEYGSKLAFQKVHNFFHAILLLTLIRDVNHSTCACTCSCVLPEGDAVMVRLACCVTCAGCRLTADDMSRQPSMRGYMLGYVRAATGKHAC